MQFRVKAVSQTEDVEKKNRSKLSEFQLHNGRHLPLCCMDSELQAFKEIKILKISRSAAVRAKNLNKIDAFQNRTNVNSTFINRRNLFRMAGLDGENTDKFSRVFLNAHKYRDDPKPVYWLVSMKHLSQSGVGGK